MTNTNKTHPILIRAVASTLCQLGGAEGSLVAWGREAALIGSVGTWDVGNDAVCPSDLTRGLWEMLPGTPKPPCTWVFGGWEG